jgi:hypothetical protein
VPASYLAALGERSGTPKSELATRPVAVMNGSTFAAQHEGALFDRQRRQFITLLAEAAAVVFLSLDIQCTLI